MRDPVIAGVLSFLIPGLGQIYNGRIFAGMLWLILTGFSWIGSAGTLGWIVHLISAWCAYSYAKKILSGELSNSYAKLRYFVCVKQYNFKK